MGAENADAEGATNPVLGVQEVPRRHGAGCQSRSGDAAFEGISERTTIPLQQVCAAGKTSTSRDWEVRGFDARNGENTRVSQQRRSDDLHSCMRV
jgi:hypothetical protein